jgi:hypothetical protein
MCDMHRGMKTLVLLFALVSSIAFADGYPRGPYFPVCGFGVSYDSYGRGVEDGFKETRLRARALDEVCYGYGVEAGRRTRAADRWSFCTSAFDHGRADGYALSSQSPDGECYSQGYKAGEAALDIDAREGVAAAECQNSYNRGFYDAKAGQVQSPPSGNVAAHCYQVGAWDASATRR